MSLPVTPDFAGAADGVEVPGFPRERGHLTECLIVHKQFMAVNYAWCEPPDPSDRDDYCTCDDWSPDQ